MTFYVLLLFNELDCDVRGKSPLPLTIRLSVYSLIVAADEESYLQGVHLSVNGDKIWDFQQRGKAYQYKLPDHQAFYFASFYTYFLCLDKTIQSSNLFFRNKQSVPA